MFVFGNADDVFGMAVRIEENGKTFYQGAAEMTDEENVKQLFQELADMEASHVTQFKTLRQQLGEQPQDSIWDPEGLAQSYLSATADSHIFTKEAAENRLKGVTTADQALDMALQFEKDSLAFFIGIKDVVPDESSRDQVDELIDAERDHIRMLSAVKKKLAGGGQPTLK